MTAKQAVATTVLLLCGAAAVLGLISCEKEPTPDPKCECINKDHACDCNSQSTGAAVQSCNAIARQSYCIEHNSFSHNHFVSGTITANKFSYSRAAAWENNLAVFSDSETTQQINK